MAEQLGQFRAEVRGPDGQLKAVRARRRAVGRGIEELEDEERGWEKHVAPRLRQQVLALVEQGKLDEAKQIMAVLPNERFWNEVYEKAPPTLRSWITRKRNQLRKEGGAS